MLWTILAASLLSGCLSVEVYSFPAPRFCTTEDQRAWWVARWREWNGDQPQPFALPSHDPRVRALVYEGNYCAKALETLR